VTKRLVVRVRQRKFALDRGMRRIQDLDLDIARANLEVEAGSNCLKRARMAANEASVGTGGLLGGLRIIDEANVRDRLRLLRSVIEEVDTLFRTESTIMSLPLSVDEYIGRISQANILKGSVYRLGGGQLSRLGCLADLRSRIDDIEEHIASQMRMSLSLVIASRCERKKLLLSNEDFVEDVNSDCAGFVAQYETLLHSRLILARQEGRDDSEEVALTRWADSLAEALCFELDKSLAHSLLDPTLRAQESTGGQGQSEYAQDLAHLRQQMSEIKDDNPNDRSKLRIILHNLFTIRFDFEGELDHLPWVYHKLCSLVVNVMQIYLEIDQWHAASGENQCSGESSIQCTSKSSSFADLRRRMENEAGDEDETDWGACLASLLSKVQASKSAIWLQCQCIFIKMLDQFIVQSTKKKNMKGGNDDESGGDGKWAVQLEGLHDVWQLTKQINDLGKHFVGDQGINTLHLEWKDKLSQIFRSHLRRVHVDSMNTMGEMLAHETWVLLPVQIDSPSDWRTRRQSPRIDHKPGYEAKDALKNTLENLCPVQFVDAQVLAATGRRSWDNGLLDRVEGLSHFNHESPNPFLERRRGADGQVSNERLPSDSTNSVPTLPQPAEDHKKCQPGLVDALYQAISPYIVQDPTGQLVLTAVTQGSMNGLCKWTARLLKIMEKLPIIAKDVTKVISNLVDMYVLTVLRLCCGSGSNEDVLLGISRDDYAVGKGGGGNGASPTEIEGRSRQSSNGSLGSPTPQMRTASHPANPISETIEADLCVPLPHEKYRLTPLREFVLRGRDSLSGMVNLRMVEQWDAITVTTKEPPDPKREVKDAAGILERQISAAISCFHVAALLDVALDRVQRSKWEGGCANDDEKTTSSFTRYTTSVIEITPPLIALATKMACMRAIKGKRIVLEIMMVGSVWKDQRFSEHSNDYVDAMCLRCSRIWEYLSSSPRKLPTHALFEAWKYIVSCSFLSLLDGFSKIVICSMEGRALMSMDLATYYAGCNPSAVENRIQGIFRSSPEPPPSISASEKMQYVDAYVKAFYFPEKDLIAWIESNKDEYHLRHMIGLLSCAAAGSGWKERRDALIAKVEALYAGK
jgi:hypothetical protein